MSFSTMSSKEKTTIAILGVIILVALVGIGVLVAKLVAGDEAGKKGIVVAETSPATEAAPQATVTLVAPPSLEGLSQAPPPPVGSQPVVVARQQAVGPLAPVIIASQPLHTGHRYRLEISAADGSRVAIQGSWGQSATSASGQVAAPQIEFFEGTTPFQINVAAPVADPNLWSCSVSAGLKVSNILGQSPALVITIWDVTGVQ